MFSPCAVCQAAGNCVRMVIGCLCCILLGGPVLFIVGIVLLVGDNNRADYVQTYNNAVANVDTSGMSAWSTAGTMGETTSPATFAMQSSPVEIHGDLDGINMNGVSFYGQNSVAWPSSATPSLTFSATTSTPFTRNGVQKSTTYSEGVRCRSSFATCSVSRMEDICRDDAGPHATYSGPSCFDGDRCGTCTNTQYLTTYCAVLQRNSGGGSAWVESTHRKSCRYPFDVNAQFYDSASTSPSNLQLQIYSDDDPLIVLESVTFGTHDFGITKAKQRRIGIILLVIGIVMTVAVCVGLCAIGRMVSRNIHRSRGDGSPASVNNNDVDGTPMQPQPYHHHHHNQFPSNQPYNNNNGTTAQGIPVAPVMTYDAQPNYNNNGYGNYNNGMPQQQHQHVVGGQYYEQQPQHNGYGQPNYNQHQAPPTNHHYPAANAAKNY